MPYLKTSCFLLCALLCVRATGQIPDSIPPPVLTFYGESSSSWEANDMAPSEMNEFGRLVGIWYCSGTTPDPQGGDEILPYNGFWAWKYILDGYGMQDFFFQGENEFLYWKYFKRDLALTQIRSYDPNEKIWKITYITNNADQTGNVYGTFTAKSEGDDMIMKPPKTGTRSEARVIFSEITENSFEWRAESSTDDGKTWVVGATMSAKKLK
ncbi:MAG: hypothetical protein ABJP45_18170 [Cyclobacteriaceae bacterium]